MLRSEDPWLLDETVDVPGELFKVLTEIRQYLIPARRAEELGLRSLVEGPEALVHGGWRDQATARGRAGALRARAA